MDKLTQNIIVYYIGIVAVICSYILIIIMAVVGYPFTLICCLVGCSVVSNVVLCSLNPNKSEPQILLG